MRFALVIPPDIQILNSDHTDFPEHTIAELRKDLTSVRLLYDVVYTKSFELGPVTLTSLYQQNEESKYYPLWTSEQVQKVIKFSVGVFICGDPRLA